MSRGNAKGIAWTKRYLISAGVIGALLILTNSVNTVLGPQHREATVIGMFDYNRPDRRISLPPIMHRTQHTRSALLREGQAENGHETT
jgi:hypothetical protein